MLNGPNQQKPEGVLGIELSVWTYEEPFDAVHGIAGYFAFYPDRVDAIEESPIR